ncbi:MAG: Tol-Pal system protein TolB [Chroococcopsis gigantea SAG 12.99]|nr:Tol-Pal system protein TolB [Chroococcopsis gigantea SAG 12.99]
MDYEYRVGGSLPENHPTYVERKADKELLLALLAGDYCYVFNSRQMGKSSLRVRVMKRLQSQGMSCASLDITGIGSDDNVHQWYNGVITQLFLGFNLAGKHNLKLWLRERDELPPVQKLGQFIEDVLLFHCQGEKVYIFIDEIDKIISFKYSLDDFFSLIRYFYNQRAENPKYERIVFALFGVATPSDLIREKTQTSFNIGRAIELTGFTIEEVSPLIQGLVNQADNPKMVLAEILEWTGGQPFLTQKVCNLIAHKNIYIKDLQEKYQLEKIITDNIVTNWESQDEPIHLRTIRDRLLRDQLKIGKLIGIYQHIYHRGSIISDDSNEQSELRLTGLVVKRNDFLSIYNPIYKNVFNQNWIHQQLDSLQPYAENIKAWQLSDYQDESRLLTGKALKEAWDWSQGRKLDDLDYQFLNASEQFERRQTEIQLQTERERYQILADAERKARHQIRLSYIFLLITSLLLLCALLVVALTDNRQREAKLGRELQKNGEAMRRQFDVEQIGSLISGMTEVEKLEKVVRDGRRLQEYPATSPMTTLAQILDNITERNKLQTHKETVYSVSISPDGRLLATASGDNTVKLWDRQGRELRTLRGHTGEVYGVSFSRDGKLIATASQDKTAKIWNLRGEELVTLKGHDRSLYSVNFSPDGQKIATSSRDKTARIWDLKGRELGVLRGHGDSVDDVSFSPDGQTIATASRDGSIRLWNLKGEEIKVLANDKNTGYYSVSFSADGRMIAGATGDRVVRVWDREGNLLWTLKRHQKNINSVNFSPNNPSLILTASGDGTAKVWKLQGEEAQEIITLKSHQDAVYDAVFSNDEKTIVTASADKTAIIWDISTLVDALKNDRRPPTDAAVASGGDKVALALDTGNIEVQDIQGKARRRLSAPKSLNHLTFDSRDGLLIGVEDDRNVYIWNLQDGKAKPKLIQGSVILYSIAIDGEGQELAIGSRDGKVTRYNIESEPRKIGAFQFSDNSVNSLAYSADGTKIAVGLQYGQLVIKSLTDGREIKIKSAHEDTISALAFSKDGELLVTGSKDGTVKLWDGEGREKKSIETNLFDITAIEFSADDRSIAIAYSDGTVKVWDREGKLLVEYKVSEDSIYGLNFTPDGQQIVTVARDGRTQLWPVERGLEKIESLLDRGCHWLGDYLSTHPQEASKLSRCRQP